MVELLPWLNLLLLPGLGGLVYVAVTLAELRVELRAASELTRQRFKGLERRVDRLEHLPMER